MLCRRQSKGGLALPDFRLYCWAFQLKNCRILLGTPDDSPVGCLYKALLRDEGQGSNHFLFKFGSLKFFKKVRLKILQAAGKFWADIRKHMGISYYTSKAPVWDSPGTPACLQDALARPLKEAGIKEWGQLISGGSLTTWESLRVQMGFRLAKFKYYQLRSWANSEILEDADDSDFITGLIATKNFKKEVSQWYWALIEEPDRVSSLPAELWGRNLPMLEIEDVWQASMIQLITTVKPTYHKRNHLFVLHRVYWTQAWLAKFQPGLPPCCKKCGLAEANDVQLFWSCPLLLDFWSQVCRAITEVIERKIEVSLALIIFGTPADQEGIIDFDKSAKQFFFYKTCHVFSSLVGPIAPFLGGPWIRPGHGDQRLT